VSKVFYQRGFPNQRPKPRSKDPLVELQKELRRLEKQGMLEERLGETEITRKVTHWRGNVF
jgi:hypothetical protein